MSEVIRVLAKFNHKSNGKPVTGPEYTAKLYDKDILVNDEMGKVHPNSDGGVDIICPLPLTSSFDSPGEEKPDLYFVLLKNGKEIFRSQVFKNVDFLAKDTVSGKLTNLRQDLGTFDI